MVCLALLRNILWTCGKYENINYMIVTQDQSPGQQLHSQSSPRDLAAVEGQRNGKFNQNVSLVRIIN